MTQQQAESVKDLAKDTVEALEYISDYACDRCGACQGKDEPKRWKWEPNYYDWVLFRGCARILMDTPKSAKRDEYIPILHWEEIERVLESVGYNILIGYRTEQGYFCQIVGGKRADAWGKSRQEAVMKAVIKLGEDQNDRIKCAD